MNLDDFLGMNTWGRVKNNIHIGVKQSISHKVMVGFMFYRNGLEIERVQELLENICSVFVVYVDIWVTTEEEDMVRVYVSKIFYTDL